MSGHSNRARPWLSVTDRQLIRRQRLRLTLVNVAVLSLIWAVLGAFVYSLLIRQTNGAVDSRLYHFAEQLMIDPGIGLQDGDFDHHLRLPSEGNLLSAAWVETGGLHLFSATSMPTAVLAKLRSLASSPAVAQSAPFTAYVGGVPYRILQFSRAYAPVTMQVAEDVSGEYDVLRDLLGLIVLAGAFGVVLTAIGGYSLGLWTLRPLMAARRREKELASDISHELRTPLSVMGANLELLLRHTGPGEQELRFVEAIYKENKRMKRLIDDLLDMAKLDAGVDVVERQIFSLREICEDVAALYDPVVTEKGLRLQLDLPAVDCRMSGDPARIRQLLFIFLDNACKYAGTGDIRLELRRGGAHLELTVSDTGVGMSPQLLARATERFVRGDEARGDRTASMGLGLAIAKRIVASHQGKLVIRSAEGKGTQVTVTLRAVDGPETVSLPHSRESEL